MNRKAFRYYIWLILVCISYSCHTKKDQGKGITIAAAANMQYAMEALKDTFEIQTGIRCELIIGSSGKLTAQIREGAPYDIFVAADMKYPEELENEGMALAPAQRYAKGTLVLWSMVEGLTPAMEVLSTGAVNHIALANPKTAPYGRAARELLESYGLFDELEDKMVYGESISQTNQFILSQSAEAGFTALSVVLSPEMKGKGQWILLEDSLYSPIEQGVILLRHKTTTSRAAWQFFDYLLSEEAGTILKEYGYTVNE